MYPSPVSKKTKENIGKMEMKMKRLDKKIKSLKYELYENVLTSEDLKNKNMEITEFTEKTKAVQRDLFIGYPDIFSYFRSYQDKLLLNSCFTDIIDALKTEVYVKPEVKLDEDTLLRCMTFPEKTMYSQWILQTVIKNLLKKYNNSKCGFDSSFEALSYLQKIMSCCNIPVPDQFPATLSILNSTSFKLLNPTEQDLLIFMHATARMQSIFDLIESVNIKQDSTQFLSSKAERWEIEKRYFQLLNQLKYVIDGMEKIDVKKVFDAISKSSEAKMKTEDISEEYMNFKNYVTLVSSQTNTILNILGPKETTPNNLVEIFKKLNCKVQQCIDQNNKEGSENFVLILKYDLFQNDVKNLINDVKKFIHELLSMSVNEIDDARACLNCLKVQANFTLHRKWDLQNELLPFMCEDNEVLFITGRSQLLLEVIKDVMFYLKILEEMEFNKHFPLMSSLCELGNKKDLLIEKFKNFTHIIGFQKIEYVHFIRNELLGFNKEIQILFNDYEKFRSVLQFLSSHEENNLQNILKDIKSVVIADAKISRDKKSVGIKTKRKLHFCDDSIVTESVHKKTKDTIEEVFRSVDETMEFLHSLDETVISKKFPAMRHLCELHSMKEQIFSSFETMLFGIFKLSIEDVDDIINKLTELNCVAGNVIESYETVGSQLNIFSDVMQIINKEKSSSLSDLNPDKLMEGLEINISDLFGTTDSLKKLYYNLDKQVKDKWFPARQHLCDLLKDKERIYQAFQNFLERMPELDIDTTMDVIHSLRQLIISAENLLRRYQSLQMQLIWIAEDYVFSITKEK